MNTETYKMLERLQRLGISRDDAIALRRISMTLHRWHERKCGASDGCIERDETTGLPYWHHSMSGLKTRIADGERGALRRLRSIMDRYPSLVEYVQGDPRGAALYVLERKELDKGYAIDAIYNRGIAVY